MNYFFNCCHSILNSSSAFCWVCVRFKFTLMNWKGANSSVSNFVQPWSRPKLKKRRINHNISQDWKVPLTPKLQHLALSELSRDHCRLPASGSDTGWIYAEEVLTMTAASSRGQLRSCLDCRASLEQLYSSSLCRLGLRLMFVKVIVTSVCKHYVLLQHCIWYHFSELVRLVR